ncbi:hypothetical protein Rsub_10784 [Raphidocelis subcapitata]|uniref:ACB domain-containing protein n=1 Tax=Raphidocelis subcapitata TaxID=307507 RepID=A0A2V0PFS8_9CHLO|nr:hypothetical protein Rsub_10784 [Raphidocelis subcapitata]|eukprot:GBF98389.1 hypothetical protein Rsub_10784 [Raphidocelis subcapitata]
MADDDSDEALGLIPGEQEFSAAADRVAAAVIAGGAARPSEADLLALYGLYKQATAGDCATPRPWFWHVAKLQQWRAWNRLRGMPQAGAMAEYTRLADARLGAPAARSGGAAAAGAGGGLGGPVVGGGLVYGADDAGGSGSDEEGGSGEGEAGGGGLREAAAAGDEAALAARLAAGARLDAADGAGCTALHFAADRGRQGALRLLLEAGADVNARDGEGQTALHYAAVCGHREVYEALLAAGADEGIADGDGVLPRDAADWLA